MELHTNVPPCAGVAGRSPNHVIGLHLGAARRVTQRRAGKLTSTTYGPGQLTLIAGDTDVTCWTREPVSFLHVHVPTAHLELLTERDGVELPDIGRFDDPVCRELGRSLAESAHSGPAEHAYREAAVTALILRVLRIAQVSSRPARGQLSPVVLQRVIEYARANLASNPGVAELAQVAGLSPAHFARCFKRSTGRAPHQFLQQTRVGCAQELLQRPDLSVLEIAWRTGFQNPSQFIAFFRRATGVTPGSWRRQR
jgi:AraC family transcriptional regulator